jgi:hypothetical protein
MWVRVEAAHPGLVIWESKSLCLAFAFFLDYSLRTVLIDVKYVLVLLAHVLIKTGTEIIHNTRINENGKPFAAIQKKCT